jgi:adenylate cyclase
MLAKLRPTLKHVFSLSLLGLLLSLALLFYLVLNGSERTVLQSAERFRDSASREVIKSVTTYLNEAPLAVAYFEKQVGYGLIDPRTPDSIQSGLLSLLLANDDLSEVSLTYAESTGFGTNGDIQLTPASAGQVMVVRAATDRQFILRRTRFDGTRFVSESHILQGQAQDETLPFEREDPAIDPTTHPTFQTPARKRFYGELLWTDLHWSQIDEKLPADRRRVEVSVQKAIEDSHAKFAGVLRVGLLKDRIDRTVQLHIADPGGRDPHLIFLCDSDGRLITGFGENDRVAESGDDLRIVGSNAPPVVIAALQQPTLKGIDRDLPVSATSFLWGGTTYLCTFRALPDTQDWIVGIVVPRDYYLGELLRTRRRVLGTSLVLIGAIVIVSILIVRGVTRAHSLIVAESVRMNEFEFSPSESSSWLHDVGDVLRGLEKAKAAMRAMGKYVPVDLVRRLYHECKEPVLGGESVELSVMFTDIKGFTPFAEQTAPDKLAEILGCYLDVMATVIQGEKGTIDKYIGDAVMAFWNAPEIVENHSILACRAALKCRVELQALYDSPPWEGAPHFETRFGLHRCVASVGHFGAPNRFNYTAIGDGINLASRLETLNNRYGTTIIASENIHAAVKEGFEFRLLDRVAVKGKIQEVTIYELVAERRGAGQRAVHIVRYEKAFEAYLRRDFRAALALLEMQPQDRPSVVLAERCQELLKNPPSSDWNGVCVLTSKGA